MKKQSNHLPEGQSDDLHAGVKPQGTMASVPSKNNLRIAALVLALLGLMVIYKYHSVDAKSIYQDHFTSYDLGTARGNGTRDSLEEAYRSRDWHKVVTLYNSEASKTAKYYFLAGMADLELQQYQIASEQFEAVLAENARNHDHYFKDEAEYFLAFSYLMNGNSDKAVRLLGMIRKNKDQLYSAMAGQISAIDLKIMDMKNKE
ncbi:MAG: hypothetical protein Q8918_07405 [Bacteroidota bacterium]|nr:hypothetical protein [Bacteroidota bacterium]MDP4214269.1 hypothetical protein [Bacteroidota bacterium]MDP4249922.1 hypothetical protein [Bacteroidota bacterium]